MGVSGDAIGAPKNITTVDYLNANNAILSNGVTHSDDGSITIPKGVTSFTASVPVIDDTLIENTEQAILSIGSHLVLDKFSITTRLHPNQEVSSIL